MEHSTEYGRGYRRGVAMAENYTDRICPGWVLDQAQVGQSETWLEGFWEGWTDRERDLERAQH